MEAVRCWEWIFSGIAQFTGKKVKFCGIFGDKFDFTGISGANFAKKQRIKLRRKFPEKKIYWKDVKFRARKKTQKFIQRSSKGNCTCFELQEKHKLYRNARPVNLLFQLQFRAEHSNAINFFSLLALLCCFAVYKAKLFIIEGSNPFVKSKHCWALIASCTYD